MRTVGLAVLIVGVLWIIFALNMDVSISSSYGGRVNNLGLMATRQNNIIIGCFIVVCGLLVALWSGGGSLISQQTTCPQCAESISAEAIKCKHCGSQIDKAAEITPSPSNSTGEGNWISNTFEVNHLLIFLAIVCVAIVAGFMI